MKTTFDNKKSHILELFCCDAHKSVQILTTSKILLQKKKKKNISPVSNAYCWLHGSVSQQNDIIHPEVHFVTITFIPWSSMTWKICNFESHFQYTGIQNTCFRFGKWSWFCLKQSPFDSYRIPTPAIQVKVPWMNHPNSDILPLLLSLSPPAGALPPYRHVPFLPR